MLESREVTATLIRLRYIAVSKSQWLFFLNQSELVPLFIVNFYKTLYNEGISLKLLMFFFDEH